MPRLLTAVCCAALTLVIVSPTTSGGQQEQQSITPVSQVCTPMKKLYSSKNWRDRTPLSGHTPCPNSNKRKLKRYFFLYRHYRKLAPYRCHGGREGYYAIPCYIIACESGFSWWAYNSSGASYIYQLLGWGAPPPSNFRNRVRNHEIAASLSLSNWVCA